MTHAGRARPDRSAQPRNQQQPLAIEPIQGSLQT